MHSYYLDAIRNFEGFTPKASWDYAQFSNGYGTRARFDGEVISQAEAERRFKAEIAEARTIVERTAPHVDEGTKAALTSLTYNAGTAWTKSGLGEAVKAGDLDQVREIFQKYNKAGGDVLPGLVRRRAEEAQWIGNPDGLLRTPSGSNADKLVAEIANAAAKGVADRDSAAARVAELIERRTARDVRAAADRAVREDAERGTQADGVAERNRVTLPRAASEALLALAEADKLTSERIADVARTAQLSRGSALALGGHDGRENETRRT